MVSKTKEKREKELDDRSHLHRYGVTSKDKINLIDLCMFSFQYHTSNPFKPNNLYGLFEYFDIILFKET